MFAMEREINNLSSKLNIAIFPPSLSGGRGEGNGYIVEFPPIAISPPLPVGGNDYIVGFPPKSYF
jgi:hypothetical protein